MTVTSIKELEAIIKLCRKTGVEHIIVDGIELNLGPEPLRPDKPLNTKKMIKDTVNGIINPNVAYTPTEDTQIETPDTLTPEQLLMWSIGQSEQQ